MTPPEAGQFQRHYAPRFYCDWLTFHKGLGLYTGAAQAVVTIQNSTNFVNSNDNPEIISGNILDSMGLNQGMGMQINTINYEDDGFVHVVVSFKTFILGNYLNILDEANWGGVLGSNMAEWLNNSKSSSTFSVHDINSNYFAVSFSNMSWTNHELDTFQNSFATLSNIGHVYTSDEQGSKIVTGGGSAQNGCMIYSIDDHNIGDWNASVVSGLNTDEWIFESDAALNTNAEWDNFHAQQGLYNTQFGTENVDEWWIDPNSPNWDVDWNSIVWFFNNVAGNDVYFPPPFASYGEYAQSIINLMPTDDLQGQTKYVNFHFYKSTSDASTSREYLRVGQLCFGSYWDAPLSPDLKITKKWVFDGTKTITTRGGATLSNQTYNQPPGWYGGSTPFSGVIGSDFLITRRDRIGRKEFDLSFSYIDETDAIAKRESGGTSAYTQQNFYNRLLFLTKGFSLPFIFETNTNVAVSGEGSATGHHMRDNFILARIAQKEYSLTQVSPGTYSTKLKIRESW